MKRAAVALVVVACTRSHSAAETPAPASSARAPRPVASADEVRGLDDAAAGEGHLPKGGPDVAGEGAPRAAEHRPTFREVLDVLFVDRAASSSALSACPESLAEEARERCLYDLRFEGDAEAATLAHEMLLRWNTVAGVESAHTMDGGYRGLIHLVPAVPIARDRKHLEWVAAAMRDFDRFFAELGAYGREHEVRSGQTPYRFRALTIRFARSTNTNRPSAYASGWTIAYNVAGSINVDADRVRETMFHEIFHLNDGARGGWSQRALATIFDGVAKRCGTSTTCLAPYSPGDTMVRGGTYYSFQPGNGVVEYAAELALRFYREQRAALRSLKLGGRPFKCGPPENARAWALMKDEFFGGIDATPPC